MAVVSAEEIEPFKGHDGYVVEGVDEYVCRIQQTLLPNWPEEILVEWLYRHTGCLEKYAFLDFSSLTFRRQTWPLDRIPGGEIVDDEGFCDAFAAQFSGLANAGEWLATYMAKARTWNTPIILLDNPKGDYFLPYGKPLKQPYHLLEGHRRLSFLCALRQSYCALEEHDVWIATKK